MLLQPTTFVCSPCGIYQFNKKSQKLTKWNCVWGTNQSYGPQTQLEMEETGHLRSLGISEKNSWKGKYILNYAWHGSTSSLIVLNYVQLYLYLIVGVFNSFSENNYQTLRQLLKARKIPVINDFQKRKNRVISKKNLLKVNQFCPCILYCKY